MEHIYEVILGEMNKVKTGLKEAVVILEDVCNTLDQLNDDRVDRFITGKVRKVTGMLGGTGNNLSEESKGE